MLPVSASSPLLRLWVLSTGVASLCAAVGAYLRPSSPHLTLYRLSPQTRGAPFARMYATWLLSSTAVRLAFAFAADRTPAAPVFWLAFITYALALAHFASELFVFRTAALRPAGFAPLLVAGASLAWFAAAAAAAAAK